MSCIRLASIHAIHLGRLETLSWRVGDILALQDRFLYE
jgi:hypothetical protein